MMKVNILRTNFATKANCQMQKYFSCLLTPKAQKESQHSSPTSKGVHNFLSSQHRANKQSRKKLFQMNCPIISVWNKQTDSGCETSYSTKHEK